MVSQLTDVMIQSANSIDELNHINELLNKESSEARKEMDALMRTIKQSGIKDHVARIVEINPLRSQASIRQAQLVLG